MPAGANNDVVWGGEFPYTFNALSGMVLPVILPTYRNYLVDAFAQDEITVFPELVSASSLLSEVLPTAEILAKRNDNILEIGEAGWDGKLFVDPTRFRQCLLNLVSNSCKFTEHGRITIDVREVDKQGEPWVRWSICDTGPGISAEGLKRLFQTFSQVDSSSTRKHGGSGLGLAISQQLCHAMGGHISVESEPGVGSTFTIHIPAANEPLQDPELAIPEVHRHQVLVGRRVRNLIVVRDSCSAVACPALTPAVREETSMRDYRRVSGATGTPVCFGRG